MARLPGRRAVAAARAPGPARRSRCGDTGGGVLQRPGRRAARPRAERRAPGARRPRARRARRAARPRRGAPRGPAAGRRDCRSASCCSTSGSWPASATSGGARPCSLEGRNPWTPPSALTDDASSTPSSTTASHADDATSVAPDRGVPPTADGSTGAPAGPCRPLRHADPLARQGEQARTAYWCPTCQPAPPSPRLGIAAADSRTAIPKQR